MDAEVHVLTNLEQYGECDPVVSRMPKYMKTHVMPHELVSLSIYEDAHPFPANDGVLNCTFVHTAPRHVVKVDQTKGDTADNLETRVVPLARRVQGDVLSTDYRYRVVEADLKGFRK